MNDDKTMIEKALAQTDTAIASAKELADMCAKLIAEKENLAAHNAMLRDCLSLWEPKGMLAIMRRKALNATQADVDAWKAAQVLVSAVEPVAFRWKDFYGIGGSPRTKYSDAAPQSPSCFEITPLYAAPPVT